MNFLRIKSPKLNHKEIIHKLKIYFFLFPFFSQGLISMINFQIMKKGKKSLENIFEC